MTDITRILADIEKGDPQAAEQLLPLLYQELRRLAAAKLNHERPGQTLQPTALVHEAYLRLVDTDQTSHWQSRGHFFAAAAEAMRRILIERARKKGAKKHGGDRVRVALDANHPADEEATILLDLNEALSQLEVHDPDAAKLVKLRYFAGFTHSEAAEMMGISRRAADRLWTLARTWIYRHVSQE